MRKTKTVPKSYRIDEASLNAIQQEAESQRISSNTLVNQILNEFTEFDRFAQKIGTVKLSSVVFRDVLSAAEVDKVIEIAKQSGSSIPVALATAKSGRVDQQTLLDHIRSLAAYAHLYEVSEMHDAKGQVFTLTHDFGLNWSIFLVHYITAMLVHLGETPKLEMTDRSVILTLLER